MILKEAGKLYREEEFEKAYELYKQAASIYGEELVSFNLKACESNFKTNSLDEDLDKKNENKASVLNVFFDNVYVVNLEHKVEDRLKVITHLKKHGIKFEVFKAINGYEGEPLVKFEECSKRELGDLKRYPEYSEKEKKRGKPFIESAGAVGYIYTYISILNDAKNKGYKKFLILEDDVLLEDDFENKFIEFMKCIDDDWKILQLGASQYGWYSVDFDEANKEKFYHPRRLDTCGSFAIAFDSTVIDELIEAESSFEGPFDHLPLGELYERYLGKCFVSYPNIIIPDVSESSIRGGRCQVEHSKKMKWQLRNFDYPVSKPTIAVIIQNKKNIRYYNSFSDKKGQPFNLNLYYNSLDGLRPLHNVEMMDKNDILPIENNLSLPRADYAATINSDDILTENDIVKYIEYRCGAVAKNSSSLYSIDVVFSRVIKDRVSVIIPTYKRPINLKNALISVLEQDYENVEIIVVSDNGKGSTYNDETQDVINSIRDSCSGKILKLIEHDSNRNGASARNTGLMNSTGEYISYLDDDDIYLQGRISKSIEALKTKPKKIGAVYCGFLGWNSPENDLDRYKHGDLTLDILMLSYKNHYLHTNTATYKREAVVQINGFDESYKRHQDLEFNLRFFQNYEIGVVEEAGVRLNPAPSAINNKVYDMSFLKIKEKFLNDFDYIISEYDAETQKTIYSIHWKELQRYIGNREDFISVVKQDYRSGISQVICD